MPAKRDIFYRHEALGAVECLGCMEMIEIPFEAVLTAGKLPERVRDNPENLMAWIELQELDHAKCHEFKDAEMQRQAREFRSDAGRQSLFNRQRSRNGSGPGLYVV